MSERPIVLSISMLVSGREEMSRSLESLRTFRETLPCEIILVDTGCGEEQRKLAESFADRVVDFAWNGDFSEARNTGLREASGEWFLYLDDDEWFEDPREILDFFLSGEYRRFCCASYVVRNYMDPEGNVYDDSYPLRMIKREADTRFVGKIHEYLSPVGEPRKTFSAFAHHYGYAYRDEKERWKHAQRNIEPLLEMCGNNPGDLRWVAQLAQEYFSIKKYEEVVRTCVDGLKEWRDCREGAACPPVYAGALYSYILTCLEALERFEEEEQWLHRALEDPIAELTVMEPTAAYYCLMGTTLYRKQKKHELCRDYFKRYISYASRLKDDRAAVEKGAVAIASGVFQKRFLYGTVMAGLESAVRTQDHELAEKAFGIPDWTEPGFLGQEEWERELLDALCSAEYHPLWVRMLQTLATRKNGMEELYPVFRQAENEYETHGDAEKYFRLCRLASELDCDHPYVLCAGILRAVQEPGLSPQERQEKVTELFGQLFRRYPARLFEVGEGVWNAAEGMDISFEALFLQTDCRLWRQGLDRWGREASPESVRGWEERMKAWNRRDDIRYRLFAQKCREVRLRNCKEPELSMEEPKLSMEELERMLWEYADGTMEFYGPFFRESALEEMPEVLPEEIQLALRLRQLRQHRLKADDRSALECMRQCLGVYPALDGALSAYAGMYRDDVERRSREASRDQEEFRRLAASLKHAAGVRLEKQDYAGAEEILVQLRQYLPGDPEINEMLQRAGGRALS